MHDKEIVFKNGLVDPLSVAEYMNGCHCEEMGYDQHKLEFHHLYFPRKKFRNNNIPPLPIRRLRNSRYNLIEILNCQEDHYHQDAENEVDQSLIDLDAAQTFLEEDQALTDLAASSLAIYETTIELSSPKFSKAEQVALAARLVLLQEINQADKFKVKTLSVMEPAIVLGSLTKYYYQRPEPILAGLVDELAETTEVIIPTKVYPEAALRQATLNRLGDIAKKSSPVTKRLLIPVLEAQAA